MQRNEPQKNLLFVLAVMGFIVVTFVGIVAKGSGEAKEVGDRIDIIRCSDDGRQPPTCAAKIILQGDPTLEGEPTIKFNKIGRLLVNYRVYDAKTGDTASINRVYGVAMKASESGQTSYPICWVSSIDFVSAQDWQILKRIELPPL